MGFNLIILLFSAVSFIFYGFSSFFSKRMLSEYERCGYKNQRILLGCLHGDVGYLITGIKDAREVKVGDTITDAKFPTTEAVEGFEDVKPMVFAGLYPVDTEEYEELRASMEKLQLNDASLVFQAESSAAQIGRASCRERV